MKEELKKVVDKWLKESSQTQEQIKGMKDHIESSEKPVLMQKAISLNECAIDIFKILNGL